MAYIYLNAWILEYCHKPGGERVFNVSTQKEYIVVYGYIRVSTDHQTTENQRFEIKKFCEKQDLSVDVWIEETISATKDLNKRKLGRLIKRIQKGQRFSSLSSFYFQNASKCLKNRHFFQKLIKENGVLVNDKAEKASYRMSFEDVVTIHFPDAVETTIEPENIPLDILYEDDDLLIVNKPKGMVVHPSAGHFSGTLVNAIMYHCKDSLSGINGEIRPGIVHRIDMDTTGSLIVCKNDNSHVNIAEQIKVHSVNRIYEGIVYGNVKEDEGTIEGAIGRHPIERKKMAINEKNGKPAITHYKVLERFGNYTYMQFKLETGRTHQIRVHMSSIGHPLLGDTLYSSGNSPFKNLCGQTLHAKTIGFVHPSTGNYMEFQAPLPEYFEKLLSQLKIKQ